MSIKSRLLAAVLLIYNCVFSLGASGPNTADPQRHNFPSSPELKAQEGDWRFFFCLYRYVKVHMYISTYLVRHVHVSFSSNINKSKETGIRYPEKAICVY
jgi:hypothetical protein